MDGRVKTRVAYRGRGALGFPQSFPSPELMLYPLPCAGLYTEILPRGRGANLGYGKERGGGGETEAQYYHVRVRNVRGGGGRE